MKDTVVFAEFGPGRILVPVAAVVERRIGGRPTYKTYACQQRRGRNIVYRLVGASPNAEATVAGGRWWASPVVRLTNPETGERIARLPDRWAAWPPPGSVDGDDQDTRDNDRFRFGGPVAPVPEVTREDWPW
jgi:hypothetical protein